MIFNVAETVILRYVYYNCKSFVLMDLPYPVKVKGKASHPDFFSTQFLKTLIENFNASKVFEQFVFLGALHC